MRPIPPVCEPRAANSTHCLRRFDSSPVALGCFSDCSYMFKQLLPLFKIPRHTALSWVFLQVARMSTISHAFTRQTL